MGTAAMRDGRGDIAERIEKYPILLKEFGLDRWFCLDAAVVSFSAQPESHLYLQGKYGQPVQDPGKVQGSRLVRPSMAVVLKL